MEKQVQPFLPGIFRESAVAFLLVVVAAGCIQGPQASSNDYENSYLHSLASPGTQFAELPAAVQRTVRAETGAALIARIDKGQSEGRTVYRIAFQDGELFPPLYVSPDGSVLYPNLSLAVGAPQDIFSVGAQGPIARVSPDDLPPPVMRTIQRLAPDAQIDMIVSEARGGQAAYRVSFKGGVRPGFTILADGTVVD
jgi:hypothetical protein